MAEADVEKGSYGPLERFLYLFMIPVLFTGILIFVLLSVFDYNVLNSALQLGNKIPIIEKFIPDPQTAVVEVDEDPEQSSDDVEAIRRQLQFAEEDLQMLIETNQAKDAEIEQLQQLLVQLQEEQESQAIEDDEYNERIQQLANVYANMTPTRAAPILENLTLHEQVLVLNEMKPADQVKILERMNPQRAAEASILLKDQFVVKDIQIAALQERLALNAQSEESSTLTDTELALTFASMAPQSAASVLVEMMSINENKVIEILRSMNVQARSAVLNAISSESSAQAAEISNRLGD